MWQAIKDYIGQYRVRRAVRKGMALLSDHQLNKVVVHDIYMSSTTDCVLGQIYGHYDYAVRQLGLNNEEMASCGFVTKPARASYSILTNEWKKQILARRQAHHV